MYHSAMEPRPVSCSSFVPLLRRMSYLILKRGFDLVFSLVLLVTCALLMAVIALVVWAVITIVHAVTGSIALGLLL